MLTTSDQATQQTRSALLRLASLLGEIASNTTEAGEVQSPASSEYPHSAAQDIRRESTSDKVAA